MRAPLVITALLAAALLAAVGARWAARRAGEAEAARVASATRVSFALPPFELTERSGAKVSLATLQGRPWVAGFVFTRCGSICPRLGESMATLQTRLASHPGGEQVRLVAFSVDPEHDTPEVLAAWAARYQADSQRWLFLTGDRAAIWRLAEQGFKLPVSDSPGEPGHLILHSQKLVLVDAQGQVRGWFDPLDDPADVDRLLGEVSRLLAEPR